MLYFALGLILGALLGLILAALLGAAAQNSQEDEINQAYLLGYRSGLKKFHRDRINEIQEALKKPPPYHQEKTP